MAKKSVKKLEAGNVFAAMDWRAYALVFALFVIEFIVLVWLPWTYGFPMSLSESGPVFLVLGALTMLLYIYLQDRRLRRARRG